MTSTNWTHSSVVQLAGDNDPVEVVKALARGIVFDAVEDGWSGPPFNPIELADMRGLGLRPRQDVVDARLVSENDKLVIEYNPDRPLPRIWYSVAHEIAHSLFPDAAATVRYRRKVGGHETDHWQLEVLCDLAAAEILMPVGVGTGIESAELDIDALIALQVLHGVSMEALLLRVTKLTSHSVAMFAASRIDPEPLRASDYRIDYSFGSTAWRWASRMRGLQVKGTSPLGLCTAVGYTAKDRERWWAQGPELRVECVGVPPFPGTVYPRVVGFVADVADLSSRPDIEYLVGDATIPRVDGPIVIAHVVNDATPNWGAGFGRALAERWPGVQADFRAWVGADRKRLRLGVTRASEIDTKTYAFHMVAQRGYRPQKRALIRYGYLEACLQQLATFAKECDATVQMPLIGTGHAGGNWGVIAELIAENVAAQGVRVVVYRLPGTLKPISARGVGSPSDRQLALSLED